MTEEQSYEVEEKVDRETATEDFKRFEKAMRLKLRREGMDENDRRDVNEDIDSLIEDIVDGRVKINDLGQMTYYPEGEHLPLTFQKPMGGHVAVIDKKKESAKVAQQYAIIGAFTRVAPSRIQAMDWADVETCGVIASLFFVR